VFHLASEYLVDSGGLLERTFVHHFGSHLLHKQHECVEWLLNVDWFPLHHPTSEHRLATTSPSRPQSASLGGRQHRHRSLWQIASRRRRRFDRRHGPAVAFQMTQLLV